MLEEKVVTIVIISNSKRQLYMANKKTDISNGQKLSLGVGLTAAAVAAAGAYFLYGSKSAPKNRRQVKSWALKAKGEVLAALEKGGKMTQAEYEALVDGVMDAYTKVEKISKAELADFKDEMGNNWSGLVKSGIAKVFQVAAPVAIEATKKAVAKNVTATKKRVAKKEVKVVK